MKTGVIFCCILAGIVLCIGTASGTVITLSAEQKSSIVKVHNEYRSDVSPIAANMIKLEWSEVLAKIAQKHLKKCTYGHSDRTERTKAAAPYFTSVGENLAATTGKITDYPSFIKKTWGAEELLYSYPNCNSGKVCGHYTQMVWASTTHVGCAVANCPYMGFRFNIFVCNYGPAGNYIGENPYVQGTTACTQCPAGLKTCSNNLCSSGSVSSTLDTSSSLEALIQLIINMQEAERERE